jgi:hypothetical protein
MAAAVSFFKRRDFVPARYPDPVAEVARAPTPCRLGQRLYPAGDATAKRIEPDGHEQGQATQQRQEKAPTRPEVPALAQAKHASVAKRD